MNKAYMLIEISSIFHASQTVILTVIPLLF